MSSCDVARPATFVSYATLRRVLSPAEIDAVVQLYRSNDTPELATALASVVGSLKPNATSSTTADSFRPKKQSPSDEIRPGSWSRTVGSVELYMSRCHLNSARSLACRLS